MMHSSPLIAAGAKLVSLFYPGRAKRKCVIASNGRAGSTLLFDSVRQGLIDHEMRRFLPLKVREKLAVVVCDFVERLRDIESSKAWVVKTHDLCDPVAIKSHRVIFIHGSPLESAVSCKEMWKKNGRDWMLRHIQNLQGRGTPEELFEKDVLNYEAQLRSWLSEYRSNVLVVGYEELWDSIHEISEFLGFPVRLPPKRDRASVGSVEFTGSCLFERLESVRSNCVREYRKKRLLVDEDC